MHSKLDQAHHLERDISYNKLYANGSQARWHGTGHDADASSRDHMVMEGKMSSFVPTFTDYRQAAQLREEEEATTEKDAKRDDEHQQTQTFVPSVPSTANQFFAQPSQLELVGHSIACAPYPYSDPNYVGVTPTHRPQPLVHPHSLGVHSARMVLPLEMAEEPVYVNAKQYHGILRRRQSRAKAELERKLIRERKPYLHESRHLHAMKRARGCGGRFLTTKKPDSNTTSSTANTRTNNKDSATATSGSNSQVQGFEVEGDCSGQKSGRLNFTRVRSALTIK